MINKQAKPENGEAQVIESDKEAPVEPVKVKEEKKVIDLRKNINETEHLDKMSLQRCLLEFTAPEILEEQNAYKCFTCTKNKIKQLKRLIRQKKIEQGETLDDNEDEDIPDVVVNKNLRKTKATKQFLIQDTPPILTIALKRFAQIPTRQGITLRKVNTPVQFPFELDLSNYAYQSEDSPAKNYKYHLSGISSHGGGLGGGHYVAYVRQAPSGKSQSASPHNSSWHYFSDSTKRTVTLSEVLDSEAYVLFYKRSDCE